MGLKDAQLSLREHFALAVPGVLQGLVLGCEQQVRTSSVMIQAA